MIFFKRKKCLDIVIFFCYFKAKNQILNDKCFIVILGDNIFKAKIVGIILIIFHQFLGKLICFFRYSNFNVGRYEP